MSRDKEELKSMIEGYLSTTEDQTNHWLRRFYRCYIDGSYDGEQTYKRNLEVIKNLKKDSRRSYTNLRMNSISNFTSFLLKEYFMLSRVIIHNVIVKTFGDKLEAFNQELMNDFVNLDEKDLSDFFSSELLESKRRL